MSSPLYVPAPPRKLEKVYKKLRKEYSESLVDKGLIKNVVVKEEDLVKDKNYKEICDEVLANEPLYTNAKGRFQKLPIKMDPKYNLSMNQAQIIANYLNSIKEKKVASE